MPRRRSSTYAWCAACSRVFSAGEWWRHNWTCPAGCGAGSTKVRRWDELRTVHPDLPLKPGEGELYPLVGPRVT